MPEHIEVKYISDREIESLTVSLLKDFNVFEILPVPIENIVDNKLALNVIPFPNLLRVFETNSCISGDLKSLYVDDHLYTNLPLQFNFALAHELGHLFLHGHIYRARPYSKIEGYKMFIANFNETAYAAFETQAHSFAGHFLIPKHHLEFHFERERKGIDKFINKIKNKNEKIEIISMVMARRLSPIFQVHERPIKIRLERSRLIQKCFDL